MSILKLERVTAFQSSCGLNFIGLARDTELQPEQPLKSNYLSKSKSMYSLDIVRVFSAYFAADFVKIS